MTTPPNTPHSPMDTVDKWRASALTAPLDPPRREVTVTDIDLPFFTIVRVMVKWSLASIPAGIILTLCAAFLYGTIGAVVLAFIRSRR